MNTFNSLTFSSESHSSGLLATIIFHTSLYFSCRHYQYFFGEDFTFYIRKHTALLNIMLLVSKLFQTSVLAHLTHKDARVVYRSIYSLNALFVVSIKKVKIFNISNQRAEKIILNSF